MLPQINNRTTQPIEPILTNDQLKNLPSNHPVGTSIQLAADQLLLLINQERELAVLHERGEFNNYFSSYRERQENVYAMKTAENKKLQQELDQTRAGNQDRLHQRSSSSETRIGELEKAVASLQNERDQLRYQLQTYVQESTAVMDQLGLYSPSTGLFSFRKHWPTLLLELGFGPNKHYDPVQFQAALIHVAGVLRRHREASQGAAQLTPVNPIPHTSHSNAPSDYIPSGGPSGLPLGSSLSTDDCHPQALL